MTSEDIDILYREVKSKGWSSGLIHFLSEVSEEKASLILQIIMEKQAGWKYLLNLSEIEKMLTFDASFGTVTESFSPHCKELYAISTDRRIIECTGARLKEKKIKNVRLIQYNLMNHLPFKDNSFDLIVLHDIGRIYSMDRMVFARHKERLEWLIKEAERILSPSGILFFSFENKFGFHRIQKKLTNGFNNYCSKNGAITYTFSMVSGIFKKIGFSYSRHYSVYPSILDPRDIVEFGSSTNSRRLSYKYYTHFKHYIRDILLLKGFFAPGFIIVSSKKPFMNFLDSLLKDDFSKGEPYMVKRYIPNSTVIAVARFTDDMKNQNGVVIKFPLTKKAYNCCKHNFKVLKELGQSGCILPYNIPKPLSYKDYKGQPFFAESALNGIAIDESGKIFETAFPKAVDLIIDLHQKTAKRCIVDDAIFERFFLCHLKSFAHTYGKNGLEPIFAYLKKNIYHKGIPLILQHGDFKLENILIDPESAAINGIIDWELSEREGLPLLDLLHLLVSRRRVLEGKSLMDCFTNIFLSCKFDKVEEESINKYLKILSINKDIIYVWIIMYWLHHITKRIKEDIIKRYPLWVEANVIKPLKIIHSLYLGYDNVR